MNDLSLTSKHSGCCAARAKRSIPCAPEDYARELAELAKAIAHPARITILRLLLERNACICGEICHNLPLAQSTISQHLKILKTAGLITGAIDGPRVCYCVSREKLNQLKTLIAGL